MVSSQLSPPPLFPPPLPLPLPLPPSLRPILYYFLVVVATATLALTLYSVIILRWCSEQQQQQRRHPSRAQSSVDDHLTASNFRVISSFKFKKEMDYMVHDHEQGYEPPECSICLSVFEEDDELKRLPRCMHCFHANCIDKWLISHLNCPLCRLDVVESTRSKEANQPGNSHVVIVLPVHR